MKQREVSFKVKSYLTKDEYENDGCPVQYFEFNDHEYYGLVAVRADFTKLNRTQRAVVSTGQQKAIKTYLNTVGGESFEEIEREGYPTSISKSEALLKFLLATDTIDRSVRELVEEFEGIENGALLVDSSLI